MPGDAAASDADDDLPEGVPSGHEADRIGRLGQRIGAVDQRAHGPSGDELRKGH